MLGFVKKFVHNSFEKPNVLRGFVFLLLPVILTFAIRLYLGVSLEPVALSAVFAQELFLWFFAAAVLFILVRLFKGTGAKVKFSGVLGALSLRYVFSFLSLLLVVLILFAVFPSGFFSKISKIQSVSGSDEQLILGLTDAIGELSVQNETALYAGFGLILLSLVFFLFLYIYLLYSIIAASSKEKPGRNLFILIIFLLVNIAVALFL